MFDRFVDVHSQIPDLATVTSRLPVKLSTEREESSSITEKKRWTDHGLPL